MAPATSPPEEAVAVQAEIVEERGRYAVYLTVVLASGAVRGRVNEWPDRAGAERAARILAWCADRRRPTPLGW